jgi:hypothetical protein
MSAKRDEGKRKVEPVVNLTGWRIGSPPGDDAKTPRYYKSETGRNVRVTLTEAPSVEDLGHVLDTYLIDGRPAVGYELQCKPGTQILIKEHAELKGTIDAFACARIMNANFESRKPPYPDTLVHLPGRDIHVEHVEVREHGQIFAELRVAYDEAIRRLPQYPRLTASLQRCPLTLAFHALPRRRDLSPFLDLLMRWLDSRDWARGADYSMPESLSDYLGRVSVRRAGSQAPLKFALWGNAVENPDQFTEIVEIVKGKQKKKYAGRPLWLVVNAHPHIFGAPGIQKLREVDLPLGHFERIICTDTQDVVDFEELDHGGEGSREVRPPK